MSARLCLSYATDGPYNLAATLSMLGMGPGDPCVRVDEPDRVRLVIPAPGGPLAVGLHCKDSAVDVRIAGREADWLIPYLPRLLGLGFHSPIIEKPDRLRILSRKFAGFRLPRLPIIFPRLIQIVLQQLVSFRDARYGWRTLVRRHGKPVPGHDDLMAPPSAPSLARMAPYEFVECGILPQHGRRITGLARAEKRIEATWNTGIAPDAADQTCQLLIQQRGVGPWTTGYLRGAGMGDSDAVVLGDYGFPKRVAYFFTGAEQADDDEMLRLLEPYRPHRFYVLALLLKGAPPPPRHGPHRRSLRHRLQPPR